LEKKFSYFETIIFIFKKIIDGKGAQPFTWFEIPRSCEFFLKFLFVANFNDFFFKSSKVKNIFHIYFLK